MMSSLHTENPRVTRFLRNDSRLPILFGFNHFCPPKWLKFEKLGKIETLKPITQQQTACYFLGEGLGYLEFD